MRDSFIENFEQSVVDAMEKNKVPGMAASILIDREVAYCRAWGVSRHGDRSAPMTPDTVCAVMSVAKGFTATAVMQLVENGAVALDDPVSRHLPYFHVQDEKYEKHSVTVKQVLSHTAGFPELFPIATLQDYRLAEMLRGAPEYEAVASQFPDAVLKQIRNREDVSRYFANATLQYPPGEGWQYCTDAYVIAGDLIEKVSGMTWEEYVRKNIFDRLHMTSTFTDPDQLNHIKNKTRYYTWDGASVREMPTPVNPICAPAGFIYSTARDMARYVQAHMDFEQSPLLRGHSLRKMQEKIAKREKDVSYGLGWKIRQFPDGKVVEHAGGYPGVAVYVLTVPATGFGVVLLANNDKAPVQSLAESAREQYMDRN